ncbi:MAG: hypothetical protein ACREXS_02850 [Gammaproteobacteria bacterium]
MNVSSLKPEEEERLALALFAGLTCSSHSLSAGIRNRSFVTLDLIFANPKRCRDVLEVIVPQIRETIADEQTNKLAFVDNTPRGPAGLLSLRAAIASEVNMDSVIIRPNKRLHASQVSGPLEPGDRVVLLCDVVTTGQTAARAYAVCARRQARVASVICVYDREVAGAEALGELNIPLRTLIGRRKFTEVVKAHGATPKQLEALATLAEPVSKDLFALVAAQL